MESLFIDTNIQYDLDLSLFPGINDPGSCSQPTLLIAIPPKTASLLPAFNFNSNNNNNVMNVCNDNAVDLDSDDLYNFIDSFDLINTDLTSSLANTGDLDKLVNDILESASFNSDGCGMTPATRRDCCTSNYQCTFSGMTPATSKNSSLNSPVCGTFQGSPSDCPSVGYGNGDGIGWGRGGCDLAVGCESSTSDCLCTETLLDISFITDELELNDQQVCKKRKHSQHFCDQNSNKRANSQRYRYDQWDEVAAVSVVHDKTSSADSPCNISGREVDFPRHS